MISWSYTFLNDLANCPHKAYRRFVAKDLPKEIESPAMLEGIRVHKWLEKAINGKEPAYLKDEWKPFATPLIHEGAQAEVKLAMTKDRKSADFWGRPWGRGKADVLIVNGPKAFLVDWKTGKVREDKRELEVQAMLLQANHPEIKELAGCYVWLAENRVGTMYALNPDRCYHGTAAQMAIAEEYEEQGYWPKVENPLCAYCPVKDCEFNKT